MKVQMAINAATIAALIWFRDEAWVVGAIAVVTTIVIGFLEDAAPRETQETDWGNKEIMKAYHDSRL